MEALLLCWCCLTWATLQQSGALTPTPAAEADCCEGDVLLLLDSSGSVSNYEFSRLLHFSAGLLRVFALGRGRVRVGLLQVGTAPYLEFGLGVHHGQRGLQEALRGVQQLQGDTNTEEALREAQQLLRGARRGTPQVLLWLTDGASPGDVGRVMSGLKEDGVFVLAVSTVHGNYQVLRDAVSPPLESHLHFVDIDDIEIITQDLRAAIIKIIQANHLRVVSLGPRRATLQWRPLLTASAGCYLLQHSRGGHPEAVTRRHLPGDATTAELTDLVPNTPYTASLLPESNQMLFKALSVDFSTPPEVLGPSSVHVRDSGPRHVLVEWGPPQAGGVLRYTVEYGTIPSGRVHAMILDRSQNSALLEGLEPGAQYLVTVGAVYADGTERAMSVKACTQEEALPALVDLQVGPGPPWRATWRAHRDDLRGYWLTWEANKPAPSAPKPPAIYLEASRGGAPLPSASAGGRVCVSPVYGPGRGDGICCDVPLLHTLNS